MRTILRVLLVLAGAVGFCTVLSMAASADVVNPKSAMTLADKAMLQQKDASAPSAAPKPAPSAPPSETAPTEVPKFVPDTNEVAATPATEQQVRQAPPQITHTQPTAAGTTSPLQAAVAPLGNGLHQVGSYLSRVVSACQVGMGSGTGGPVVVLAVLGLVAALERRRILGVRPATDEDVPEFLYAGEISPPG